jgi:hypothetical protein
MGAGERRWWWVALVVGSGLDCMSTGNQVGAVGPDVDGHVAINELMALNVLTATDGGGARAPWIELYNPTDVNIPLDGYALTDDTARPHKAPLPRGSTIAAHGYLVLWCDGVPGNGAGHVGVELNPAGGSLALARPDGSFIQQLTYGAGEVDMSAAREPDGSATWAIEWAVSPGAANPSSGTGDSGGADGGAAAAAASPTTPAAGTPEMVPAAGDQSDRILGYDLVPELGLTIADADIASLRAQPETWVQAQLVYAGRSYGPVGVNLRGTRSFQPIDGKAGFRVNITKFVKDARFFGLEELTINNMTTDYSMMHERLAYWTARQVGGLPGLRSNHALLTVNGTPYGLYANVETPKPTFLARWFTNATGSMFSIHYADFATQFLSGFLLQSGPDDLTLINGTTTALTMSSPDAAMAAAAQYVDMDEFTRYWAWCAVVAQFSSKWPYAADGEPVGNDAGLYADPTTNRLWFIPEGTDDAFYDASYDFLITNSVLTSTCQKSPACLQKFTAQAWDIIAKLEQVDWLSEFDRVAAQTAPYTMMDTRKPYSDADVAMYRQQMRYFISGREATVAKWAPPPP